MAEALREYLAHATGAAGADRLAALRTPLTLQHVPQGDITRGIRLARRRRIGN